MSTTLQELKHAANLGYRMVRPVGNGPLLLVQFVTSRCNAHCEHCFDWARQTDENAKKDLSLDELTRIAKTAKSTFFVILTGGEPFLRRDIGDVISAWAHHARPRVLALPTNGSQTQKICDVVDRVAPTLPSDVYLSINVSLDGLGPLHDDMRGTPGLFEKATNTVRGLRELTQKHENLGVGVVSGMSKRNQHEMEAIMDFVLDDLQLPIWAPFLCRGNPRDMSALEVDIERYEAICERFEARILDHTYAGYGGFVAARLNSAKNIARRSIIARTVREQRRIVPCSAGRHSAVIYSDGNVHSCELLTNPMGNVREFDYDLTRLWKSEQACKARGIVDTTPCACTHENTLTTSVAYAWRQWPSIIRWTYELARA